MAGGDSGGTSLTDPSRPPFTRGGGGGGSKGEGARGVNLESSRGMRVSPARAASLAPSTLPPPCEPRQVPSDPLPKPNPASSLGHPSPTSGGGSIRWTQGGGGGVRPKTHSHSQTQGPCVVEVGGAVDTPRGEHNTAFFLPCISRPSPSRVYFRGDHSPQAPGRLSAAGRRGQGFKTPKRLLPSFVSGLGLPRQNAKGTCQVSGLRRLLERLGRAKRLLEWSGKGTIEWGRAVIFRAPLHQLGYEWAGSQHPSSPFLATTPVG